MPVPSTGGELNISHPVRISQDIRPLTVKGGYVTVVGSRDDSSVVGFEQFERIAEKVGNRTVHPDPDLSWRAEAACRDTSPELFFPIGTTGQAVEQIAAAKLVCMGCPAQEPCLEFALATNQDSGVWGATSEEDRRHLRRTYISRRR